jgi:CBS domain-containing protein
MLVRDLMTPDPVTVHEDLPVKAALALLASTRSPRCRCWTDAAGCAAW